MKTYIRRRDKNKHLVVFYGAWGTDENVFTPLCNDEFDFILFYNYSADEALVLPEMKTYEKITLIGWSLGVWAAEYLCALLQPRERLRTTKRILNHFLGFGCLQVPFLAFLSDIRVLQHGM